LIEVKPAANPAAWGWMRENTEAGMISSEHSTCLGYHARLYF
jgi:hypothetical protein